MIEVILDHPGHFRVRERPEPSPGLGETLVRVHRVGICGTDLHAYAGKQPFFSYPRILGHELGVEVVDPGAASDRLQVGDRCAVEPYLNCGRCIACRRGKPNCCTHLKVLGVHTDGGMRQLLSVPSHKLHRGGRLDYDQLALVETLAIGAHAVERAQLSRDDTVLIVGAGPIGLSVIQFAQLSGANLIVADISESRLAFCRSELGIRHTMLAGPLLVEGLQTLGDDLPTCAIDATGSAHSMTQVFDLVAHGGRIVFVGLCQDNVTFNDPNFHRRELTLSASRNALPTTFQEIISLVEGGRINTRPWITHRFDLAELPRVFASHIAGQPSLLKAMIHV